MHVKKKVDITYQCNVNLGRFLSTRAFKLLDLLTCWADRKEILTSVTKYPYVSPLPEAPSTLECYWYVDVSSGTETRSGLPSRALCLQRTLLIHFPFLSPFFFPTAYVYVCPADYRKRRYAVVYLLYPVATVEKYEGHVWVPSCLNIPLLSSLTISLSFLSLAATHQHPRCYEQVVYSRVEGISWFRFSKLCLLATVRSSYILPPPFLFWNPWVPSSCVYILPDSFPSFYSRLLTRDLV